MLFSSQLFILLFLPTTAFIYHWLPNNSRRMQCLILASFIFYGYWDYRFLPLLICSITLNWLISSIFYKKKYNWIILAGIALNLFSIGVFKYYDFFANSISYFTNHEPRTSSIILPLGISFFTFQQISYLIDLKRGHNTKYTFNEYVLFITFFPQLIAGPIVRHNEIIKQFTVSPYKDNIHEYIYRGLILFTLGLVKKVFFADELSIINDEGVSNMQADDILSSSNAWFFALSYTLQLYFDFSAYSDMAIGLGAIFGFKLPRNFNIPYRSLNLQDFWRRWHMTLSRFFRDYLYIPMGGSQNGIIKYISAVLVTMTLCGLWHGAGWSFVLWGFLHGCGLIVFSLWKKTGFRLPSVLAWLITFLFVICGWVLFRIEDIGFAAKIITSMFTLNQLSILPLYNENLFLLAIGLVISILGPTNHELALKKPNERPLTLYLTSFLLFASVLWLGGERELEFIYFQF